MQRRVAVTIEHYPIAGHFTIARGSRTVASVVLCTLQEQGHKGRGECVPYARYGETLESVRETIEAMAPRLAAGMNRDELGAAMPAGAARNAIDCALWDLDLKSGRVDCREITVGRQPAPLLTAFTLSIDTPEAMARAAAAAAAHRPLLKIKLGRDGDRERMAAVRQAAPGVRLVGDANEGWSAADLEANLAAAHAAGFEWIEQPLPAGDDRILARIESPVTLCADESVHVRDDLPALRQFYDAINIKLDKTGGLTEAIALRERARELGFRIMVGCMVGTSLAMAPAVLLAQDAELVDLDGPLLLAQDREAALRYEGSQVFPPHAGLWGTLHSH